MPVEVVFESDGDLSAEYCRIAQARVGGTELVVAEIPEDTEPEWEE